MLKKWQVVRERVTGSPSGRKRLYYVTLICIMLLCSFHIVYCKFFHIFTPDSLQCKLMLELPCMSRIIFSCWVQTIQVYMAYHVCMLQLFKYKSFWWSNKAIIFHSLSKSNQFFEKFYFYIKFKNLRVNLNKKCIKKVKMWKTMLILIFLTS